MQTRRNGWWPWLTAGVAFVVAAIVFEPVWPREMALASLDSPPYYLDGFKAMLFNGWINHQMLGMSHDSLLALLLPPLVYHDASYMASTALLALAVAAYLKGRGLPLLATMAGALAMAFSGYHFALFNPGHRGYFVMMPYAVFLLALIDRAAAAPRWSQFALMAICVAFGVGNQPDVLALMVGVAVLYALLRVVQCLRRLPPAQRRRRAGRWLAGVATGALALAVAGASAIQRTLTVTLKMRQQQIAGTTPTPSRPDPRQEAAAQRDAWVFATNWSLPPEDLVEFVVPNVRGYDSQNPHGPYWGRLGQTLDWARTKQGFPNFRQHGLYLGVLQVLFALFAVVVAMGRKQDGEEDASLDDAGDETLLDNRGIVLFWAGIAVVATVLALGRYTPFYRLFYAMPLMSNLRAPVKFHHITELAVAILCGFGLAALLRAKAATSAMRRRGLVVLAVAVVAAVACVGAALAMPAQGGELAERWNALGLGSVDGVIRQVYVSACLRAAALFGLGALLFGLVRFAPNALRGLLARIGGVVAVLVIVVDMAVSARPYVNPVNMAAHYARNPIADALLEAAPPDGAALAIRLGQMPLRGDHPVLWTFQRDGFDFADPPANADMTWLAYQSRSHFGADARKQWQLWGAKVILVLPEMLPQLANDKEFALLGTFAVNNGRLVRVPPEAAQLGAVEFRSWIPTATVYTRWRSVEAETVWTTLAANDLRLEREAVVVGADACDSAVPPRLIPAELATPASRAARRRAVVKVTSDAPGMLVLRERFDDAPMVYATVNGKRQKALRANAFFWAVPVGAGESTVVFAPSLAWWRLGLNVLTVMLGAVALWREGRRAA
jgi:hypothetical protein